RFYPGGTGGANETGGSLARWQQALRWSAEVSPGTPQAEKWRGDVFLSHYRRRRTRACVQVVEGCRHPVGSWIR
ncbi:unnamed protein product, partial [Ectocarpus fasciculatus]